MASHKPRLIEVPNGSKQRKSTHCQRHPPWSIASRQSAQDTLRQCQLTKAKHAVMRVTECSATCQPHHQSVLAGLGGDCPPRHHHAPAAACAVDSWAASVHHNPAEYRRQTATLLLMELRTRNMTARLSASQLFSSRCSAERPQGARRGAHPADHWQEESCDDAQTVVACGQLCNLLRRAGVARCEQRRGRRAPAHRLADRRLHRLEEIEPHRRGARTGTVCADALAMQGVCRGAAQPSSRTDLHMCLAAAAAGGPSRGQAARRRPSGPAGKEGRPQPGGLKGHAGRRHTASNALPGVGAVLCSAQWLGWPQDRPKFAGGGFCPANVKIAPTSASCKFTPCMQQQTAASATTSSAGSPAKRSNTTATAAQLISTSLRPNAKLWLSRCTRAAACLRCRSTSASTNPAPATANNVAMTAPATAPPDTLCVLRAQSSEASAPLPVSIGGSFHAFMLPLHQHQPGRGAVCRRQCCKDHTHHCRTSHAMRGEHVPL